MRTVTMNISLPDELEAFVDARVKARGYSSVNEYMREQVRRDEERAAGERSVALLDADLNAPPGRPIEEQLARWQDRIDATLAAKGRAA